MKRSAMTRKTPMPRGKALTRASEPAKLTVKLPKCSAPGCRARFVKLRATQEVCGEACAQALVEARNAKTARLAEKLARDADKAKREAMKGVPELKREARDAFNAWVRARDAHQPCISCGSPPPDMTALHAGRDAGHYRSTGAADHLRFHPDNCHAQCVRCNQHMAGNVVMYRQGLIERIGLQRLEALEANSARIKWTRDGLRQIRDTYRAKLKALKSVASPSPNSGAQLGACIA